ncbi:hypothetical protein ACFSHP_10425 [Novosphingobium panipatense]
MLQASYIVDEAAPQLNQLAAPLIETYNVPVYDFTNSRTALVTTITGGIQICARKRSATGRSQHNGSFRSLSGRTSSWNTSATGRAM